MKIQCGKQRINKLTLKGTKYWLFRDKTLGTQNSAKRESDSFNVYIKKRRKTLNQPTNFQLKKPGKEQTKLKANRKKEIKIIAEIK